MSDPAPSVRLSLLSRLVRGAAIAWYRAKGWHIEGRAPDAAKFVIVGAPHTSNWDFLVFLGATHQLGIRPSFMGKHSLFRWPLDRFMRDMGGIPVDRGARAHAVDQVAAAFDRADELALVVAPEGTRSSDGRWHSGFYHIAIAAGVPIVPAWLDLGQRIARIGEPLTPSGDYRADLHRLAEFYRALDPANPRFAEIEREAPAKPALSKRAAKPLGGAA